MRVSMSAGARILREKERRLLQLEQTMSNMEPNSDDDTESLKIFEHKPLKSLHLSDMELTDSDESSGISSTELSHMDDRLAHRGSVSPALNLGYH